MTSTSAVGGLLREAEGVVEENLVRSGLDGTTPAEHIHPGGVAAVCGLLGERLADL